MQNRRKFIKNMAVGTTALALNSFISEVPSLAKEPKTVNKPIVLSTWNRGIKANAEAWKILNSNGKALDAVENGVRIIEADPEDQSVGFGGRPDRDGNVTLDACIMDENFNIGAVAFLQHIMHPISVARLVMEKTPHTMLVGEGALQFALSQGFKKENLLTEKSKKEWQEWLKTSNYKPIINIENHDTIGMIAMDVKGNLSGACTTSGLSYKMHGRVGDSPIIGAGLYVDNEVGAAVATGVGEEVIRIAGSHTIVELMRNGKSPMEACREAISRIIEVNKKRNKSLQEVQVGFLALNKEGQFGAFSIQKGFTFALYDKDGNRLDESQYYY